MHCNSFIFSFLEILRFFSVIEIYIKMSEISYLCTFRVISDFSISDVHTCVEVYTSCHFGAFFRKCTILLLVASIYISAPLFMAVCL